MQVTHSFGGLHSESASYLREPFPPLGAPSDPSSASPRLRVKHSTLYHKFFPEKFHAIGTRETGATLELVTSPRR